MTVEFFGEKQKGLASDYAVCVLSAMPHIHFLKDDVNVYVFGDNIPMGKYEVLSLSELENLGGHYYGDGSVMVIDLTNELTDDELFNLFFGEYIGGYIQVDGETIFLGEFLNDEFCWDKGAFLESLFNYLNDLIVYRDELMEILPDDF